MICSSSTPSDHHDDSNPQNSTSDLSQFSDLSQQPRQSLLPLDRVSNLSTGQQTLLSLAACCHSFDRLILQAIAAPVSISISDDDWHGITQFPFVVPVEDQEDAFQLSEDVRIELHQSLWVADAEQWHTLHGGLADYFQGRSHTIIPADASPKFKYENEEWRSLTTEYLYHLILSERPGFQTIVISHLLEADNLDILIWTRFYAYKLDYQRAVIKTVIESLARVPQKFAKEESCPLRAETLAFCRDFRRFDYLHSMKRDDAQRIIQACLEQLGEVEGLAKFSLFMVVANYATASEQLGWLNQAYDQAMSCFFPDDPELNWYMFGRQLAQAFYRDTGLPDKALECHNRGVEYYPNNPISWYEQGLTLSRLDRTEEAIASYDKAIECNPDYGDAWQHRGNALYLLGRVEEALASYKQTASHSQQSNLENIWRSIADFMHRQGHSEKALVPYDKAIEINPENPNTWAQKAEALAALGQKAQAVVHYGKAAEYAPRDARWSKKQGEILEELGRHEEAKASYEQGIIACENAIALRHADRSVSGLWSIRGNFLRKLNRCEEAIASYDQAIEKRPYETSYRKQKAQVLEKLGRNAEAIAIYEEALALCNKRIQEDRRSFGSWHIRSDMLMQLNRYEEVITCCDKALEYNGAADKIWLRRGQALAKLGCYQDAIATLDNAIEVAPGYAKAWFQKGLMLMKLERYEDAIAIFDRILELEPDSTRKYHADAIYNKACCFSRLGQLENAIEQLEQVIQLNPKYRESALKDDDLAALGDRPEFQRLRHLS